MTIQQLLDMKLYEEASGGFVLTVKHTHKATKVPGGWTHELTLTDDTGDILADMVMEVYTPFVRRQEIKIILCEIQPSTKGKKLLVKKWEKITCTADELPERDQRDPLRQNGPNLEARGKTKCRLACSSIEAEYATLDDSPEGKNARALVIKLADWVMSEKDIYNG